MWSEGSIKVPQEDGSAETFTYQVKHFDEGSQFGIDGGRISKLWIATKDRYGTRHTVANYDRGWDIEPEHGTAAEIAYQILLKDYN